MKQTKQTIFVSCGQRTEEERELGRQICDLVNSHPAFCAYFADMQSNLRGLNENILDKLGDCVGFVTVMHPRGTVSFSNGKQITRGSVWIEQEIAIAAHIQRTRKQDLRVAAYSHEEVEREGLRELLQLNPTVFTNSSQILSHLKEVLNNWQPDEGSEELASRGKIASVVPTTPKVTSALASFTDSQRYVLKKKLEAHAGNTVRLILVGHDFQMNIVFEQVIDIFKDSGWRLQTSQIGMVGVVGNNFPSVPYLTSPDIAAPIVGKVFSIFFAVGIDLPLTPNAFMGSGAGATPDVVIVLH